LSNLVANTGLLTRGSVLYGFVNYFDAMATEMVARPVFITATDQRGCTVNGTFSYQACVLCHVHVTCVCVSYVCHVCR
jgi:hypothetical protein